MAHFFFECGYKEGMHFSMSCVRQQKLHGRNSKASRRRQAEQIPSLNELWATEIHELFWHTILACSEIRSSVTVLTLFVVYSFENYSPGKNIKPSITRLKFLLPCNEKKRKSKAIPVTGRGGQ
jgi:hypothetical protein